MIIVIKKECLRELERAFEEGVQLMRGVLESLLFCFLLQRFLKAKAHKRKYMYMYDVDVNSSVDYFHCEHCECLY